MGSQISVHGSAAQHDPHGTIPDSERGCRHLWVGRYVFVLCTFLWPQIEILTNRKIVWAHGFRCMAPLPGTTHTVLSVIQKGGAVTSAWGGVCVCAP